MSSSTLIPARPPERQRRGARYAGSFMYDVPGRRGRRNIVIGSIISCVILGGLIAAGLWQFASHGQLAPERWTPFATWPIWRYLVFGLLGTLEAAAVVAVLGGTLGVLLALGRTSRSRPVRWLCTAYIEIGRTIPVLLMIYLMLFGLPQLGLTLPTLWQLVIPLTVANSAVFAEIVRAGVLSLPRGQHEAALSLGMRRAQSMRYVILPQAIRNVAPSLVTQFVSLLKDTSLGYIVAFTELLYRGQILASYLHLLIPTYVAVTVIYLVVNGSLTGLAARMQRTQTTRVRAVPTPGTAHE